MRRRCKHEWEIVGSVRQPGLALKRISVTDTESHDLARELLYGVTVLSLRCVLCGLPETKRVTGEWRQEPSEMEA
ncbi:MAG: hypothetical protein LC798_03230 [Chloroflexi bacterium]|nr:hypothetical protein [Chloroflexota bacterium]